ncbi:MAG TPA: phytoene/squalene synthase family protein [Rhodanobacteraceae bacterium]|nr:phytoene/squalene synthase family protein [Rhodanobacteraceae bacterium]
MRMHTARRTSYQDEILPRVSRTFALTIPQLPRPLRRVVTNFYLLCRIADTIEDESALTSAQKQYFHDAFIDVVAGDGDPERFALELAPLLVRDALDAERNLVAHSAEVLEVTHGFNPAQRMALSRCIRIMCSGMPRYERSASVAGLRDQRAMDQYCYYVAGVVGETLTELFCDWSPEIAVNRETMLRLGVSFGQGLQMVNILKDFWEDHDRGVCWLPQNLFRKVGVELGELDGHSVYQPGFGEAYARLISIAHGHLRNGFEYTLLIPEAESGIRRFCLLALGLAVQTLQLIHQRPAFKCGSEVKVSHRVVTNTLIMTHLFAGYDQVLRRWFTRLGRDLPVQASEAAAMKALAH